MTVQYAPKAADLRKKRRPRRSLLGLIEKAELEEPAATINGCQVTESSAPLLQAYRNSLQNKLAAVTPRRSNLLRLPDPDQLAQRGSLECILMGSQFVSILDKEQRQRTERVSLYLR